jgi:uncharacterized membrane protein
MLCDGNMMTWMWLGSAFWLLLAVAVLLFFVRGGFPWMRQNSSLRSEDDQAIVVLRRRFASGDIDEMEYRERLEILEIDNRQ